MTEGANCSREPTRERIDAYVEPLREPIRERRAANPGTTCAGPAAGPGVITRVGVCGTHSRLGLAPHATTPNPDHLACRPSGPSAQPGAHSTTPTSSGAGSRSSGPTNVLLAAAHARADQRFPAAGVRAEELAAAEPAMFVTRRSRPTAPRRDCRGERQALHRHRSDRSRHPRGHPRTASQAIGAHHLDDHPDRRPITPIPRTHPCRCPSGAPAGALAVRFVVTAIGSVGGRTVGQVVDDVVRCLDKPRPCPGVSPGVVKGPPGASGGEVGTSTAQILAATDHRVSTAVGPRLADRVEGKSVVV